MSEQNALSHLRVLDLSRVLAGPWASQMLADLGADVIKIERPGTGDDTRAWGPPFLHDAEGKETGESAYFLSTNRNKRSLTVDITTEEGQKIVRDLTTRSDIVIENFKHGGLAAYGLDYASLRQIAPQIIYCSITGFGQTGPYAERAGYDFLIQAMGGLMSVTGRADHEAGAGPMKVGVALTDVLTGLYASNAILAALAYRDRTGIGQHIDLALFDVQVATLVNQASNYLVSGTPPERLGNSHPNIVPYQDFPTADGNMIIAVGNDAQFRRLCAAAGCASLADDPRFASNRERVRHRDILVALLCERTRERSTHDWVGALEAAGVPCGPINDLAQVFADPQAMARGLRVDLPHPAGTAPGVASPIRLSHTPVQYRRAPPTLGQHTEELLADVLGYDETQIAGLAARGII
jgi:crotonobetainyl-CoA:carnitine CoA-transferase CaiB-like acyl-CoA transferase